MAHAFSTRAPLRVGSAPQVDRRVRQVKASATVYVTPSNATAANELQALSRASSIVPDTLLLDSPVPLKAATVSTAVLKGVLASEQLGLRPYQTAIQNALNYDKCSGLSGDAKLSCQLDKALANVGALMAQQVEGRVCTELDPRLANDTDALVSKARAVAALYDEMGVPGSKLIFRLPATWAGLQAAAVLEAGGLATQAFHVYSFVQGAAAAQAGVSVVQPNVGRTRDWYNRHPGVIRDPQGPREDSGFASRLDPGLSLVTQLYNYIKLHHPKTAVMASGLRTKEDALALAGCDYLVLSGRIMEALEAAPTLQGYNAGLTAAASASGDEDGVERQLSLSGAAASGVRAVATIDEATFNEQLGVAGRQLLDAGLAGLLRDVHDVLPYLSGRACGMD